MTRTETVVLSELLTVLPPVSEQPTLLRGLRLTRPVDPDFAASVAAGYVESLDQYTARINRGGTS